MKKNKIGTWITSYNPDFLDILSHIGFKWIAIDMEHSSLSIEQFDKLVSISKKLKLVTFVRLDKRDKILIKKSLDIGVDGIIFSMIENNNDVNEILKETFYYPKGKRGVSLSRAQLYGLKFREYYKNFNKQIRLILQIESAEGISNLDDILKKSKKNIYGIILGPYDLSSSLGVPGKFNSKIYKNNLQRFLSISKKNKVKVGYHLAEYSDYNKQKKTFLKKFDFYALGTDILFQITECSRVFKIFDR